MFLLLILFKIANKFESISWLQCFYLLYFSYFSLEALFNVQNTYVFYKKPWHKSKLIFKNAYFAENITNHLQHFYTATYIYSLTYSSWRPRRWEIRYPCKCWSVRSRWCSRRRRSPLHSRRASRAGARSFASRGTPPEKRPCCPRRSLVSRWSTVLGRRPTPGLLRRAASVVLRDSS